MESVKISFICDCQEICYDIESFDHHQKTDCPNRRVKCSLCNEGFPSTEAVDVHLSVCSNVTNQCPVCQKPIQRGVLVYHLENQCANVDESTTSSNPSNEQLNQTSALTVDDISYQEADCTDQLNADFKSLIAGILPINDQIHNSLDFIEKITYIKFNFFQNIEAWRQRGYQIIDQYCDRKRKEFVELLEQEQKLQKVELDRIQIRVNQLIEEQIATQELIDSINYSIRFIDERLKQSSNIQSTWSPLIIDNDHLIHFDLEKSISKNILPLTLPYHTIIFNENNGCIAGNKNHFLIIQNENLCLYNQQWQMIKTLTWTCGALYDMFWSNAFDQFIFITEKGIWILNDKTMTFSQFPVAQNHETIDWYGGTCSNNSLFLFKWGWNSPIYEYTLRPLVEFKQEYQSLTTSPDEELILHCTSNNKALGYVVKNSQDQIRFDLCSTTTMERYWSVELGLIPGNLNIRCCSLNNDYWMVLFPEYSTLLHISSEGELVERDTYQASPWYAIHLDNDDLLILTESQVNMHKLP